MESFPRRLLIAIAELAGGVLSGLVLGWLGLVLGRLLGMSQLQAGGGWSDLVDAVVGAALGCFAGVVVGTTVVSRRLTNQGSFLFAFLGALAGSIVTFALLRFVGLSQGGLILPVLFVLLTTLGAMLALHRQPWR